MLCSKLSEQRHGERGLVKLVNMFVVSELDCWRR
jgi:hypothetical protein